jgi:replicative DNA helicase
MTARTETLPPPSDETMEKAVLGAMLLERDALPVGLALLRNNAEVFYPEAHRHVFRAMEDLHSEGAAVDQMTVISRLRANGKLEKAGGLAAVAGLTMAADSAAHLQSHCLILLELYTKRVIAQVGYKLTSQAYSPLTDAHELTAKAQALLNTLQNALQVRRPQTVGELFHPAVDEIVAAAGTPNGITGIPSGLWALDKITGGWQPSDLIIIAARPGMGKTSVTLAVACMAEAAGVPGFFASLEMSSTQLVKKVIATELGYTTSQLTKGANMSLDEAESIRGRAVGAARSKLVLDDTPGLSISEFRAKLTKAVAEHNVGIAYVDYLQLMTGEKGGNRQQEIGSISRGLKLVAKELNIPIIALAQLSRSVETRGGDKKPMLSDIREAGDIEQDADLVIFPYRPEYYDIKEDEMGNPTAGLTELIIAKHRNGSPGSPIVKSNMATGKYEDLDGEKPFEVPAADNRPGTHFPTSSFETDGPAPF